MKGVIDRFWRWFRDCEDMVFDAQGEATRLMMEAVVRVKEVDPGLVCDFELGVEGKQLLIISAEGRKDLFATVMRVVDAAPELDNTKVRAFRPRRVKHMNVSHEGVSAMTGDVFFLYGKKKGKMVLRLYFFGVVEVDERMKVIAQVMVDNLLGEYDAATRTVVESVGRVDEVRDRDELVGLLQLPAVFDDVMGRN